MVEWTPEMQKNFERNYYGHEKDHSDPNDVTYRQVKGKDGVWRTDPSINVIYDEKTRQNIIHKEPPHPSVFYYTIPYEPPHPSKPIPQPEPTQPPQQQQPEPQQQTTAKIAVVAVVAVIILIGFYLLRR